MGVIPNLLCTYFLFIEIKKKRKKKRSKHSERNLIVFIELFLRFRQHFLTFSIYVIFFYSRDNLVKLKFIANVLTCLTTLKYLKIHFLFTIKSSLNWAAYCD